MASIKGVKLTGVQSHMGAEGMTLFAYVSVDGKKVGSVFDDAWGGPMNIDIPEKIQADIVDRYKQYIKDAYIVDEIATMRMDADAVAKAYKEKTLPLVGEDGRYWEPVAEFVDTIANLAEREKNYKKAVKKGHKAIVCADYIHCNGGTPLGLCYFTNGSKAHYDEVVKIAKEKSPAVIVKQYSSPADFVIA